MIMFNHTNISNNRGWWIRQELEARPALYSTLLYYSIVYYVVLYYSIL